MKAPTNADGFAVRLKMAHRDQVMMHLHALDELIREDHPVRNIWRYVESLDLFLVSPRPHGADHD